MQGKRPSSTSLPGLLGQGGLQQLQDTAHQVQAACDQHVDGSLLEYHGPTVCHRVGREAPWGIGRLKDRVPALGDPPQAWEMPLKRTRLAPRCGVGERQQQGAGPPAPGRRAPGVRGWPASHAGDSSAVGG